MCDGRATPWLVNLDAVPRVRVERNLIAAYNGKLLDHHEVPLCLYAPVACMISKHNNEMNRDCFSFLDHLLPSDGDDQCSCAGIDEHQLQKALDFILNTCRSVEECKQFFADYDAMFMYRLLKAVLNSFTTPICNLYMNTCNVLACINVLNQTSPYKPERCQVWSDRRLEEAMLGDEWDECGTDFEDLQRVSRMLAPLLFFDAQMEESTIHRNACGLVINGLTFVLAQHVLKFSTSIKVRRNPSWVYEGMRDHAFRSIVTQMGRDLGPAFLRTDLDWINQHERLSEEGLMDFLRHCMINVLAANVTRVWMPDTTLDSLQMHMDGSTCIAKCNCDQRETDYEVSGDDFVPGW